MKLSVLFKKDITKPKVKTLDKKQLEKVIGGADEVKPIKTRATQGATFGEVV